jgi:two-component system, cell cycle sensor histidine kinase and response regulator CckA
MDDEEAIRKILELMLDRLGYETESVGDGEHAVTRYTEAMQAGRPFAAVILDLTIPERMGGIETAARLRAVDPHVRTILSSGYSRDPNVLHYREKGFQGVMVKPFRLQDVAHALQEALAAP